MPLFIPILILAVFALLLILCCRELRRVTYVDKAGQLRTRWLVSRHPRVSLFALANYAPPGTHCNSVTRFSDVNLPTRNLLMKKGGADGRMTICGAGDLPIGFCPDETTGQSFLSGASTFSTYPLALLLLGAAAKETRLGVATGAVAQHAPAFGGFANGRVGAEPVAPGTYYQVGTFVTSGVDGDDVEIDTCTPRKLVIA